LAKLANNWPPHSGLATDSPTSIGKSHQSLQGDAIDAPEEGTRHRFELLERWARKGDYSDRGSAVAGQLARLYPAPLIVEAIFKTG